MPRKPRRCATPVEPPAVEPVARSSDPPTTLHFDGPDGPQTVVFSFSPAERAPEAPSTEPVTLTPEMRECLAKQEIAFRDAERERLSDWTALLPDPRNLTLGNLKELQSDIERCCNILELDPLRADTGRRRTRLYLIRAQANGFSDFLAAVDEALQSEFSAAAVKEAIGRIGRRPGLSPRKAEALTLAEAAEMLRLARDKENDQSGRRVLIPWRDALEITNLTGTQLTRACNQGRVHREGSGRGCLVDELEARQFADEWWAVHPESKKPKPSERTTARWKKGREPTEVEIEKNIRQARESKHRERGDLA